MANATPAKTTRDPTVSDDLRTFIRASGMTAYRLARRSGVDRAMITRFLRRERSLTGPTLDALCATLGLALLRFDDLVETPAIGEAFGRPRDDRVGPGLGAETGMVPAWTDEEVWRVGPVDGAGREPAA